MADFLASVKKLVAARRQDFQIIVQPQATQLAVHMADAVNAVDDFLPDVAAFAVSPGPPLDATFERDVRLVHVRAKTWNACLNARGLKRLPAARATTKSLCSGNQFIRHRAERIVGDK